MRVQPPSAAPTLFSRWTTACLDLVFPPRCASCGRIGHLICPACAQQVQPTPETICRRCGHLQRHAVDECVHCASHASPLTCVRAAGLYVEPLRHFIHLLKYEQRPDLGPPLARYLMAALQHPDWDVLRPALDALTPVPLHAARRAERGYNQSELLAAALSQRAGIPLRTGLIERTKATRSQVGLTLAERQANVGDAFVAASDCRGLHILLIDDVYTTGATLTACAQAALDAGADQVCGLTLATPSHELS